MTVWLQPQDVHHRYKRVNLSCSAIEKHLLKVILCFKSTASMKYCHILNLDETGLRLCPLARILSDFFLTSANLGDILKFGFIFINFPEIFWGHCNTFFSIVLLESNGAHLTKVNKDNIF